MANANQLRAAGPPLQAERFRRYPITHLPGATATGLGCILSIYHECVAMICSIARDSADTSESYVIASETAQ